MYGAEPVLPEEIKHWSLWTAIETTVCPNEAEEKDLLESDRLKAVANLQKISGRDKDLERLEGKTARIRCRKSDTFAKPPYWEYEQVWSQVDRTICGNRQDEAQRVPFIIHSRLTSGAFLKSHRFLCLNQIVNGGLVNYKRAPTVVLASCTYCLRPVLFSSQEKLAWVWVF
jgi:hypothetical protein